MVYEVGLIDCVRDSGNGNRRRAVGRGRGLDLEREGSDLPFQISSSPHPTDLFF